MAIGYAMSGDTIVANTSVGGITEGHSYTVLSALSKDNLVVIHDNEGRRVSYCEDHFEIQFHLRDNHQQSTEELS